MAASYHLSPNGPRLCKAQHGGCPYAAAGEQHYASQQDAQAAYEARMAQSFGTVETVKRSPAERMRQATYSGRDEVRATARAGRDRLREQARLAAASPQALAMTDTLRRVRELPAKANARISTFEARMEERSRDAQARRDVQAAAIREKANRVGEKLKVSSRRAPEAAQAVPTTIRAVAAKRAEAQANRTRFAAAHRLRVGDRVEGHTVAKVIDNGDSIRIHLRSDKGTFVGARTYADRDVVPFKRASKRALRQGGERPRTPFRESAFFKRVKAASELQRETVRTLMGVDARKLRHDVARDNRKKPLPERYRRATAVAAAQRTETVFALQEVAARRPRSRARIGA